MYFNGREQSQINTHGNNSNAHTPTPNPILIKTAHMAWPSEMQTPKRLP